MVSLNYLDSEKAITFLDWYLVLFLGLDVPVWILFRNIYLGPFKL